MLDRRLDDRVDDMISRGLLSELAHFHSEYNARRIEQSRYGDLTRVSLGSSLESARNLSFRAFDIFRRAVLVICAKPWKEESCVREAIARKRRRVDTCARTQVLTGRPGPLRSNKVSSRASWAPAAGNLSVPCHSKRGELCASIRLVMISLVCARRKLARTFHTARGAGPKRDSSAAEMMWHSNGARILRPFKCPAQRPASLPRGGYTLRAINEAENKTGEWRVGGTR